MSLRCVTSSTLFLLAALDAGCAAKADEDTIQVAQEIIEGLSPPPHHPPPCASDDECAASCPPDIDTCVCAEGPRGGQFCLPACEIDADCPRPPPNGIKKLVCHEGVCWPESLPPGPPPPPPCQIPPKGAPHD